MFFLIFIPLLIFLLWVLIIHILTKKRIIKAFKDGNVSVYGPKGYGKDVLFNEVIHSRKDTYYANLDYGDDYHYIKPVDLELSPNTYHNFIKGEYYKIPKNENLEGHDIYFSDAGVIFPSQADALLHKLYPSLPTTYALSRHLYNNGIHCNAQRLERIWKALREQSDYYIRLRKHCLILPFFIVLFTTEYVKYESALQNLEPLGSRLFNKYSKAEKDKYNALHGFIKNGFILVPKWHLKYDSRVFHRYIFGYQAPKELKRFIWNRTSLSKKSNKKEENIKKA